MNWLDQITKINPVRLNRAGSHYIVNGKKLGIFSDGPDMGETWYVHHMGPSNNLYYGTWKSHASQTSYIEFCENPDGLPQEIYNKRTSLIAIWNVPRIGPRIVEITYMNNNKKLVRCVFNDGLIVWWTFAIENYNPFRTNFCKTKTDEMAFVVALQNITTTMELANFFNENEG